MCKLLSVSLSVHWLFTNIVYTVLFLMKSQLKNRDNTILKKSIQKLEVVNKWIMLICCKILTKFVRNFQNIELQFKTVLHTLQVAMKSERGLINRRFLMSLMLKLYTVFVNYYLKCHNYFLFIQIKPLENQ